MDSFQDRQLKTWHLRFHAFTADFETPNHYVNLCGTGMSSNVQLQIRYHHYPWADEVIIYPVQQKGFQNYVNCAQ